MTGMNAVLYRHFDLNGNLLYVGVSISALKRLHQHKKKSDWFEQIDTVQLERFDTMEAGITDLSLVSIHEIYPTKKPPAE